MPVLESLQVTCLFSGTPSLASWLAKSQVLREKACLGPKVRKCFLVWLACSSEVDSGSFRSSNQVAPELTLNWFHFSSACTRAQASLVGTALPFSTQSRTMS